MHVGWDPFIQLNCFVLFQSCNLNDFADFFCSIMDPAKQELVPRKVVDRRLNLLFAGDFNDLVEEPEEDDDSEDSEEPKSPGLSVRDQRTSRSPTKLPTKSPGKSPTKRRMLAQARGSSRLSSIGAGSQNSERSITSYEETKIIAAKVNKMLRGTRGYAADIKRALYNQGAVTLSGQLVTERLRSGFVDGTIDIEAFKAALK